MNVTKLLMYIPPFGLYNPVYKTSPIRGAFDESHQKPHRVRLLGCFGPVGSVFVNHPVDSVSSESGSEQMMGPGWCGTPVPHDGLCRNSSSSALGSLRPTLLGGLVKFELSPENYGEPFTLINGNLVPEIVDVLQTVDAGLWWIAWCHAGFALLI